MLPQTSSACTSPARSGEAQSTTTSMPLARDPSLRDGNFFRQGGISFAELNQWKDATAAFKRCVELLPSEFGPTASSLDLLPGQGDRVSYKRLCWETIQTFGRKPDASLANHLAWLAAPVPEAVPARTDYDGVLRLAKKAVDTKDVPALI